MWHFISPVNLIRYLIVWRVNSSLTQLPRYLPLELSAVLGKLIADRLPTAQAREWRKALAAWDEAKAIPVPDAAWPIETVLFVYPAKRTYGQGELIVWELKLLGRDADHGLFLELILPAMETAAITPEAPTQRYNSPNSLWGRFDIQAIYAARGRRWEPFVTDGKLDAQYRADPRQWADGLEREVKPGREYREVLWLTPFDLGSRSVSGDRSARPTQIPPDEAPTLDHILDALIERMTLFLPGKHRARPDEVWAQIPPEEQTALWHALQETQRLASSQRHSLEAAHRDWPGRWIGSQTFPVIPHRLLPYLELASILHIGRHTHFGCGTLALA